MKRLIMLICIMLFLSGCANDGEVMMIKSDTAIISESESMDSDISKEVSDTIFVYVCGAVKRPGVYELDNGSRVYEAINAAGGTLSIAKENSINQAELLTDGQKVYVSDNTEINNETDNEKGGQININTAGVTELMNITGIGQTKAESIVSYRESNGRFLKPEDITKVTGIGEATYIKIKDQITVG